MADPRPKAIAEFIGQFRVEPGRKVHLPRGFDPAESREVSVKEAKQILHEGVSLLAEYQMRLAAQDTHGVVMVLQAMDAAGKDGTIRHVMSGGFPKVSKEALEALQSTKVDLVAQAPKGAAPDPFEEELTERAAKKARKGKKA